MWMRKWFHFFAFLVFLPGIALDPDFTSLVASVTAFLFIVAEVRLITCISTYKPVILRAEFRCYCTECVHVNVQNIETIYMYIMSNLKCLFSIALSFLQDVAIWRDFISRASASVGRQGLWLCGCLSHLSPTWLCPAPLVVTNQELQWR